MTNNKSTLKISFLPIAIIAFIIFFLISVASFWNQVRTQNKLTRIQAHTEAIYEAHKEEFIKAAKSDQKNLYGSFISEVNAPERGIYLVRILVKDSTGNYHIRNTFGDSKINVDDVTNLTSALSNEKSISTSDNLLKNTQGETDYLFGFTPIKENGTTLGFVMVTVRKDKDL